MDIDGGNTGGPQTPLEGPQQPPQSVADIDMSFLQQFSCLGTTDHDELVNQLQKIIGNQLNLETARFFLDMNNWNLQAAVGCYFDFNSSQKLPSMKILADETIGAGEGVTPNTEFVQSWRVQNVGDDVWPAGCFLKCTSHPIEGAETAVNQLQAGDSMVISVNVRSPETIGSFQAKWRLCTSYGSYFGDIMWLIVQVSESGTLALTQQLQSLHTQTPESHLSGALVPFVTSQPTAGPIQMAGIPAPASDAQNGTEIPFPEDTEMW